MNYDLIQLIFNIVMLSLIITTIYLRFNNKWIFKHQEETRNINENEHQKKFCRDCNCDITGEDEDVILCGDCYLDLTEGKND